jgi:hypothetical protein
VLVCLSPATWPLWLSLSARPTRRSYSIGKCPCSQIRSVPLSSSRGTACRMPRPSRDSDSWGRSRESVRWRTRPGIGGPADWLPAPFLAAANAWTSAANAAGDESMICACGSRLQVARAGGWRLYSTRTVLKMVTAPRMRVKTPMITLRCLLSSLRTISAATGVESATPMASGTARPQSIALPDRA